MWDHIASDGVTRCHQQPGVTTRVNISNFSERCDHTNPSQSDSSGDTGHADRDDAYLVGDALDQNKASITRYPPC